MLQATTTVAAEDADNAEVPSSAPTGEPTNLALVMEAPDADPSSAPLISQDAALAVVELPHDNADTHSSSNIEELFGDGGSSVGEVPRTSVENEGFQ
ncbi:unnamed protein product [Ilex paraguariensis]|uniref:Uncharacterized protein n=1 Tax=Ilex paraguariensis TaxID=185542 RepID=A0ABC8RDF6_9AQUA